MGTKYPQGESPIFPPRDWTCPECGKYHTKPHFAFPDQVDRNKRPTDYGRVRFNRAMKNGDDALDLSQPVRNEYIGQQGPMILDDKVQGLFCPHCGWEEHVINIIIGEDSKGWISIEVPRCSIHGCKSDSIKKKKGTDLAFCKEHWELVK